MKIILTSDVDDIGLAGEVKTVRPGLARNYLIPRKLAIEATDSNLRDWAKKLEDLRLKREKAIADAREFADGLAGKTVLIEPKFGSGDKMFGSVDARTIAEALLEQHGIEVERKKILLEKNIKSAGRFEVPVRVRAHIKTSVTVEVKAEGADEVPDPGAEEAAEAAGFASESEAPAGEEARPPDAEGAAEPAEPEESGGELADSDGEPENKEQGGA